MDGIRWIKLSTRLAADSKIRHIRSQPGGDTMVLLWIFLLCRAGTVNDRGRVYVAKGVPYTAAGLAGEFGMSKKRVADALALFEQLGMIALEPDALVICNWAEHQNVGGMERAKESREDPQERARAASRESSRRYRERQKAVTRDSYGDITGDNEAESGDGENACHGDGEMTQSDSAEKEIDREEEGEPDIQKALGIDDEYKVSSRARAKTASLLKDAILARGLLAGHLPKLFDAIEAALGHGYTPADVLQQAVDSCGDWARFASALMIPKRECATE